ncbi:hypothetical protein [Parabacteroides sp. PF5-9]|uniref:hypothetical protein n=1 Tax=Parabacteroides sp. PF5-9 TaxID=1742404 RepID=UPI0024746326|nr:hypothetical protein [Parabacteroides sp. PF5-9]MDH6357677.1 hypothetical protein [Parabacteroides sp. PF5-9]
MTKTLLIALLLLCSVVGCKKQTAPPTPQNPLKITFESQYEVAGQKFSLKDLGLESSDSWDKYQYLELEMRASSPQRFQIGFNTDWGYNELRVMPYAVGTWSRLCIPLRLYREKPRPSHDLASYNNIPFNMGWYNLGDAARGPLTGVDWVGIRMHAPIGDPTLEIRSIRFSETGPNDAYLGTEPLIDEFGQWNLGNYDGKVSSLEELQQAWKKEAETIQPGDFNYSRFGGYKQARIDNGTGYFRVKKIDGRWWFVDPEGYLFLSVAVDCIRPGGGTDVKMLDQRSGVYKEIPPKVLGHLSNNTSFGNWNLARRYGQENWIEGWANMAIKRMEAWGINTIANWSDRYIINKNEKPFMLQLGGINPGGGILGLPNVYAPDFAQKIDEVIQKQVTPYKENPWLIGWFTGNEPAWLGEEVRLADLIMEHGDDYFKGAINKHLATGDTPEKRKEFAYNTLRIYLETVDKALEKYDPHHLHIGLRLGNSTIPADQILDICKDVYDVYSFNSYSLTPSKEYMDYISNRTDLPMIIGEFHFGTTDRGMAQSLWQVDNQKERGVAYRYYVENGYAHPALIGAAYFQWCDQSTTGRTLDGENYNCGIVDVVDLPYVDQVEAMIESAKRLYGIHMGEIQPVTDLPKRPRGYGLIPNKWNE